MPSQFANIPPQAKLQPREFKALIPDKELKDFKDLLSLSKLGPATYENSVEDGEFGVRREWLKVAKETWERDYDWKQVEERINSFPNFTVPIDHSGEQYTIHFVALFSQKEDAVPVLLLHGWPGSFLEFLDVLAIYQRKYSAASLPYHIIVPSLPGFAYSSGPPLDRSFQLEDQASILDALMVGLGFSNGYIAQGGDIGSFLSRILGSTSKSCKAVHLNFCAMQPPDKFPMETLDAVERAGLLKSQQFVRQGTAYAMAHSTRPATIGLVLSSSPLALLAWIGEKHLEWSGASPSVEQILDTVTLYWLTETFSRCIFPYRNNGKPPSNIHASPEHFLNVPVGYSYFPEDFAPVPVAWVKTTGNLVWHRRHARGGHFAATEEPEAFANDIEDFVAEIVKNYWKT